jgi:hypothetical protein
VLLSVAIIVILVIALGTILLNNFLNHPTVDNDGDSDNGGVIDFHEINTYGTDPNNATDDQVILANLPNVTVKQWDIIKVGGFSTENYVNKSLTDPLIQYLAHRSEIRWSDDARKGGILFVDGAPIHNGSENNVDKVVQPAFFFTHGRNGNCVESNLTCTAILKLMGFKTIEVRQDAPADIGVGHTWSEALIDGKVYMVNYGGINLREGFYEKHGWVPNSSYDPEWYLK